MDRKAIMASAAAISIAILLHGCVTASGGEGRYRMHHDLVLDTKTGTICTYGEGPRECWKFGKNTGRPNPRK